ncbi:hypothetical protein CP967_08525 [Streptomyces nitrosporeus]|uniref:Uncharacterized protein n=1 Tax=Streptomyces nitrosporeus TaxID=28894 RepID=A0A5J6F860_9ACTN|nr:hypothetical protein [Streptomyces nitrosporeus]QEU72007.1 hypothetical protein CP967_08525 [Streptomyces nitrosporeus]GGY81313.1 hypothetical protein GCM10010327_09960 [Streptomyces nitrosporeus]
MTTPDTPRIPLDALTSDALDALYDRAEKAEQHRDYWHAELMCADARIRELEAKVAARDCA